jgi:tetratricopeptide (TPR) repeat protein
MSAKKPSPPPVHPPAPERRPSPAMEAFERAMKVLGKRDFDKARQLFDALIASHPAESELVERARSYRVLCTRELDRGKKAPFKPHGFDELLNHGIYLHNRGEYPEALACFQKASQLKPDNEHVLYCVAASSARAGDAEAALTALRGAIALSPAARAQARSDSDFDSLRGQAAFAALVQGQAS